VIDNRSLQIPRCNSVGFSGRQLSLQSVIAIRYSLILSISDGCLLEDVMKESLGVARLFIHVLAAVVVNQAAVNKKLVSMVS
jgi:hypothetical protein